MENDISVSSSVGLDVWFPLLGLCRLDSENLVFHNFDQMQKRSVINNTIISVFDIFFSACSEKSHLSYIFRNYIFLYFIFKMNYDGWQSEFFNVL